MSVRPEQYDIIRRPVITEKATMASEAGAVVFEVAPDATKPQIRAAVEAIFGVKVKAVNTVNTRGGPPRAVIPPPDSRPRAIPGAAGVRTAGRGPRSETDLASRAYGRQEAWHSSRTSRRRRASAGWC
jgi:ribosomal protein L23